MNAGKVIIDIDLNQKSFERQISEAEDKLEELVFEFEAISKEKPYANQEEDLKKLEVEIEKTKNKIISLKEQQDRLDDDSLSNISTKIGQIAKKVGKWTLAVFGVRSAYSAIRSAMGTLSQYNEQLANQITNIQYALASALEPVVTRLVDLVYTLMQYVNYVSQAWFNVSLFANKAAKSTGKAAKSLSSAGFDEINKVSSSGSAGGTTPAGITDLPEGEVPKWLKWIADNKKIILDFLKGALGLFILIKGVKLADDIFNLAKGIKKVIEFLGNPSIVGIIALLSGVVIFIKGIVDYLNDPSWENFLVILGGIALIVGGLYLLFGGTVAIIGLIIAAVVALGVAIYKNWEDIKSWFNNVGKWVNDKIIQPIKDKFNSLPGWMKTLIKGIINSAISMLNFLINKFNTILAPIRTLIVAVGKVMGKNWNLSNVKIPTVSYLATGGIISNPGKGVALGGNAYGGEKGREGVLPLTDTQTMSALGQEIARYVNINNIINNNMDSRRINRTLTRSLSRDTIMNNG